MSLTLTIADNADGSGAVATVAGSAGGSSNVVYVQPFLSGISAPAWSSGGSRTGNGDVALSLSPGLYFAYVASAVSTLSPIVYFITTAGAQSVHYSCLLGTQAAIQAASLGFANSSVVVQKVPLDRNIGLDKAGVAMPAVIITPGSETMDPTKGMNSLDAVTYPVQVVMAQEDNQETTLVAGLNAWLLKRQNVLRGFRHQPQTVFALAPTINDVQVDPRPPIVPEAWRSNLLIAIQNLNFISREPRGFNT